MHGPQARTSPAVSHGPLKVRTRHISRLGVIEVDTVVCETPEWPVAPEASDPSWCVMEVGARVVATRVVV